MVYFYKISGYNDKEKNSYSYSHPSSYKFDLGCFLTKKKTKTSSKAGWKIDSKITPTKTIAKSDDMDLDIGMDLYKSLSYEGKHKTSFTVKQVIYLGSYAIWQGDLSTIKKYF